MNLHRATITLVTLLSLAITAASQTKSAEPQSKPPEPMTPAIQEVIRRFATAESENKIARNNYTFTQDVDIRTLGAANSVTGQFRRVSDVVYDNQGVKFEKITFFPPSTLTEISLSLEDMQDLAGVQPFALATEDLPKYQVDYMGKEKIDELTTHVFEVKPKAFQKGERYFQGRVWVDDRDLQIVKVAGQAVPEVGNQKFPHFESYRENIDERYWFPTYVYADDVLDFKKGPSVHLRMVVKYTNYRKFTGFITIGEGGEAAEGEEKPQDPKKEPEKKPQGSQKEPEKKPDAPPTKPAVKPPVPKPLR
jgi:hypothetical protein